MKSPDWSIEELELALELYLSKDISWHNSISNSTWEVIALSEILRNLDIFDEPHEENFRSENSVRLKFANFKAVDDRYENSAMENIGKQDRVVWNEYHSDYKKLLQECKKIIKDHYKGLPSEYVKEYLKRFDIEQNENYQEIYDKYIKTIYQLTKETLEISKKDLSNNGRFLEHFCDDLRTSIETQFYVHETNQKYNEHAEINLKPIKQTESKIGKYVQAQLQDLINSGYITEPILNNFLDEDWSRNNFHLNHPFAIPFDRNKSLKEQGIDTFGHCRYWKKIFKINGKNYLFCKEWFEPQRRYFDCWLDTFKLKISPKELQQLLIKIKTMDEKNTSIKIEDLHSNFSSLNNFDEIIERLIKMNVLVSFQGSKHELIVEDYELLFEMINKPGDYAENE